MRWIFAAAFLLSTAAAQAATPLTGTTGATGSVAPPAATEQTAPATADAPAPKAHKHRRSMQEHFDAANTTHDGHLTLEQAKEGFPSVARDFDAIDTTHKGYVTVDDIKAHRKAARAARHAAKTKG